jgi:hypothetical protein
LISYKYDLNAFHILNVLDWTSKSACAAAWITWLQEFRSIESIIARRHLGKPTGEPQQWWKRKLIYLNFDEWMCAWNSWGAEGLLARQESLAAVFSTSSPRPSIVQNIGANQATFLLDLDPSRSDMSMSCTQF